MPFNFSHQRKIFAPELAKPMTIVGIGAVGSKVAVGLVCVGVTDLTVLDPDHVSSHNPSMSAYRKKDLGRLKVAALSEIIWEKAEVKITGIRKEYAGEPLRGSVVVCVDTMEARMAVWKAVRGNPLVDVLIDTRVSEVVSSVFAIRPYDPEDIEYYERCLYPSEQAKRQMCGEHGIAFVTDVVAARACRQLTLAWSAGKMTWHQYEGHGSTPYLDIPGATAFETSNA